MHLVALLEQELGQVGAVLAGDSGDQRRRAPRTCARKATSWPCARRFGGAREASSPRSGYSPAAAELWRPIAASTYRWRSSLAATAQPRGTAGNAPLTEFELRCFSQHGEDGVIAELLARVGIASGYFVEFGIESGREGNCVFLADVLGWYGLFIEPDETSVTPSSHRKYAATERSHAERHRDPGQRRGTVRRGGRAARAGRPLDRRRRPGLLDLGGARGLPTPRRGDRVQRRLAAGAPARAARGYRDGWDRHRLLRRLAGRALRAGGAQGIRARAHRPGRGQRVLRPLRPRQPAPLPRPDRRGASATSRTTSCGAIAIRRTRDSGRTPISRRTVERSWERQVPRIDRSSRRRAQPRAGRALAARTDFVWHQRFELADGVYTPGVSDVPWFDARGGGSGTTRRTRPCSTSGRPTAAPPSSASGAARDASSRWTSPMRTGSASPRSESSSARASSTSNRASTSYPKCFVEQFDVVLFWGVLYHLRHPLLALDNVRRLARGNVSIETAVSDHELGRHPDCRWRASTAPTNWAGDSSNWFAPERGRARPTGVAPADWSPSE